jgi:hypothetical protein
MNKLISIVIGVIGVIVSVVLMLVIVRDMIDKT